MQILIVAALLATALIVKARKRIAEARGASVRPLIRSAIGAYVSTGAGPERRELESFYSTHSAETQDCILEFLVSIAGNGHARLSELAVDLGLVAAWQRAARSRNTDKRCDTVQKLGLISEPLSEGILLYALSDENITVRTEAARALVRQGDPRRLATVFHMLPGQQLFFRAILVEELEPYAITLAAEAIPAALRSGDVPRTRECLDVLDAWQRALPLPDLPPLLSSSDPELRSRAVRALPLAFDHPSPREAVLRALEDPDFDVRAAAAGAARRLHVVEAVPALASCLNSGAAQLARAAAEALGGLGPPAWQPLEAAVLAGIPPAAGAALEALEKARLHTAVEAHV